MDDFFKLQEYLEENVLSDEEKEAIKLQELRDHIDQAEVVSYATITTDYKFSTMINEVYAKIVSRLKTDTRVSQALGKMISERRDGR